MLLGQDFLPPTHVILGPLDLWVAPLKPVIPSFLQQGMHAYLLPAGRESPADLLPGWQIFGMDFSLRALGHQTYLRHFGETSDDLMYEVI
ncbi:hypothetical protein TIFTF001_045013 [Ficus carica]|uniref:Uncharacterized protein n=1 Tax=Ficus carica TaxID=3494 RepID=A0AA88CZ78_FICCA|nr:hypothetical protein TIFTF001_045013 [Ficus carica]